MGTGPSAPEVSAPGASRYRNRMYPTPGQGQHAPVAGGWAAEPQPLMPSFHTLRGGD